MRHIGEMPDVWRAGGSWVTSCAREGFHRDTYKRVLAFPDFRMHLGRTWTDARMEDGRIRIETSRGPFHADFAICGLGTRQNIRARPELAGIADQIALWGDRFAPPPGEEDPLLAAFPYLGQDYAFQERVLRCGACGLLTFTSSASARRSVLAPRAAASTP